jgi:microcystin-dependent protein
MPAHVHSLKANNGGGATANPEGNFPAGDGAGNALGYATSANATMSSTAIGSTGGGTAHENMPPFLGVNFIIALEGLFPSRN